MDYQGRYIIWGPPGTGKTTRLAGSVKRIVAQGGKVLLTSLTRTAAAEIAGRGLNLPKECIGTLHSHAFRSIGGEIEIAETKIPEWNAAHRDMMLTHTRTTDGDDPYADAGRQGTSLGDELKAGYDLMRARCVPRTVWAPKFERFAMAWEQWKGDTGYCDFTDLLDLAIKHVDLPPTVPDVMLVDEAQDHSSLEMELINKWAKNCRATIITGDPWQALYTWRGADPSMFNDTDVPDDRQHVLSQSYRVSRAVHAAAMQWIRRLSDWREITYAPRDEDGDLSESPATWRMPDLAIEDACRRIEAGQSVMFATSCGYQLTPLVGRLRSNGIPFANPWRTKRGDWNPLRQSTGRTVSTAGRVLAFLRPLVGTTEAVGEDDDFDFGYNAAPSKPWSGRDVSMFADLLRADGVINHGQKTRLAQVGKSESAISGVVVDEMSLGCWFTPKVAEFLARMNAGEVEMLDALRWLLDRLTPNKRIQTELVAGMIARNGIAALTEEPKLYVGTIHSFKGAEADCVYLFPDLSPSGMQEWEGLGEGRDSIVRMMYVGLTRAKQEVVLCRPSSGMAVPMMDLLEVCV